MSTEESAHYFVVLVREERHCHTLFPSTTRSTYDTKERQTCVNSKIDRKPRFCIIRNTFLAIRLYQTRTNTVHVSFDGTRHLKVNHQANILDIDTTASQISCDKYIGLPIAQAL